MSAPSQLPWSKKYPPSVNWSAALPVAPLYDILDDAVKNYPGSIAIDFLDKLYTYREIGDLVARAAKGLQDIGLKKGDRIGLFLPNTPYYLVLYFAALKIGATVVNFNPLYVDREIEKQISDCGCTVMATIDIPTIYSKLVMMLGKNCLKKIIVARMADILP